jgi:hypothetical protein
MGSVKGVSVKVGCFTESSFKTLGGSPSGELLYFRSFGVKPAQARTASEILSGFRGRTRGTLGQKTVAGTIATELAAESICFLLKHLVGAPATTGAGPYEHVYEVGDGAKALPPGAAFEIDYGAVITGAGRRIHYKGCRINQATFTFTPSGPVACSFEVLGADWDGTLTDPLDASLTDPGHNSFSAAHVAVVLSDGSAVDVCFNQLTLVWSNDLDDSQYCISGGGVRDALDEGFVSVGGAVTALFDNAALLNKILADGDCSLVITIQRGSGDGSTGNEKVVFTVPAIAFDVTAPEVTGPRGVTLQANWSAHRASGEIGAKVQVFNARATV